MKTKIVKQSELTADCFLIQMFGLESCETCEVKDTDECGGGGTLKKLKNEKRSSKNL